MTDEYKGTLTHYARHRRATESRYVFPFHPDGWMRPVDGDSSTNTAPPRLTRPERTVTAPATPMRPNPLQAQITSLERELEHKAETISVLVDRLTRAGLVADAARVRRNQGVALRAMVKGLLVIADKLDGTHHE